MSTKNDICTKIFLKHWEWDTLPNFIDPAPESIEDLFLHVYDCEKKEILASYPWRRAIKYVELKCKPDTTDGRYQYGTTLPSDFLKEVGFWGDKERGVKLFDECTIQGKKLLSRRENVTIGYICNLPETEFDVWFENYFEIQMAANLARIGGQTAERQLFLMQQAEAEFIRAKNRDYEMTAKDEISPSLHQFCEWY